MSLAGLRPVGRRGDAADRDRDDARRIPDRKIVSRQVLAQARHRVELVFRHTKRPAHGVQQALDESDVFGRRTVRGRERRRTRAH